MNETERVSFDARAMFPEAARRADVLERLKRLWGRVVQKPVLARNSTPVVLGVNVLTVEVTGMDANTRGMLEKMKGNISSALKWLGYDAGENFTVKIVETVKHEHTPPKKDAKKIIIVDEERVRQYMSDAPDTLPEDINHVLSHLRAYLEAFSPPPRNHS